MKFNKLLVLALATAGALAATGQAVAFEPNWATDRDGCISSDNVLCIVPNTTPLDARKQGQDFPLGTVVIWHAGSSASTDSMQKAVVSAICEPNPTNDPLLNTIDILEDARTYLFAPGTPAGGPAGIARPSFWTVACTAKAGISGVMGGSKIMWNKRDEGGSGVGISPLSNNFAVAFMKPSTGAGNNCPGDGPLNSGGTSFNNYVPLPLTINSSKYNITVHNCINFTYKFTGPETQAVTSEAGVSDDAVLRIPDIGTADVELDKFFPGGLNDPTADFGLIGQSGVTTLSDVPGYFSPINNNTQAVAYLTFGIPVNLLMYQDLQRMQFPGGSLGGASGGHPLYGRCNPAGALYSTDKSDGITVRFLPPPNSTTPAGILDSRTYANSEQCMPSLMGNEIRSIFSSQPAIRNSTDLQFKSIYNTLPFTTMAATGASNNVIEICRRNNGSGTQAQANAIFMGYPCDINTDGSIDALRMRSETDAGSNTINNEGSGDVELCLNDFNNGANATGRNGTLLKRWAIGIQSLEKNAPNFTTNTYANAYRFIKIDGFAPTIANVHAGDYYDFAAQNLQYRSSPPSVPAPAAVVAVAQGGYLALGATIGTVTVLPSLNRLHAFGTAGWLAIPAAPPKPTAVLDLNAPVAWYRRVSFSGKFNTCALPSMFNAKFGVPTRLNNSATVGPQNCSNTSVGGPDNNCYTDANPVNILPTE